MYYFWTDSNNFTKMHGKEATPKKSSVSPVGKLIKTQLQL